MAMSPRVPTSKQRVEEFQGVAAYHSAAGLTLIMGIFMKQCNNLLIAFWIHFCFNLSLRFFAGDVYFFAIISVLYAVVALTLLRIFHKSVSVPSPAYK